MFMSTQKAMTAAYVKLQMAVSEFKSDERGVTAIEYALVAVAIATVVGAIFNDGNALSTALDSALTKISSAVTAAGTASAN